MEVFSSSVEDQLIDGLSYKLSPGASYITERKVWLTIQVEAISTQQLLEQKY